LIYNLLPDIVKPSRDGRGTLRGTPTRVNPNPQTPEERDTNRSLIRENESAQTLAYLGYTVRQNPSIRGVKKPDYRIRRRIFDCYAPISSKVRNIASNIEEKVKEGQAYRIVLNLDDSSVSINELQQQLITYLIVGLKEILVLKNRAIILKGGMVGNNFIFVDDI
jgi:filamentous hemagglutinin